MSGPRDLCIMACVFCRDVTFHNWLAELAPDAGRFDEEEAKDFVTGICGIESRSQLDKEPAAAARFHELVRAPYLAWKEAQHVG
jgi:hypothetical protein